MERKLKHLEFIQGVINRLSTNSFLLKGWSVLLISALFALSAKESSTAYVFLAYIPLFVFWALDGYFLWQERQYRNLYNWIRTRDVEDIDFTMNLKDVPAPDEAIKPEGDFCGWFKATFSLTVGLFHGVLFVAIIFVGILL